MPIVPVVPGVFDNTSPFGSPVAGSSSQGMVGSPTSGMTPTTPPAPGTPISPSGASSSGMPWRRGHSRQASLGTTKTSPSNRRRSLENTMHLIRDVVDGRDANADGQLRELAEVLASPTRTKPHDGLA